MGTGLQGDLKGKVIVVTGGAQGVGGAAAQRAAEWGAAGVVIVGRRPDKGAQAVAEIEKRGARGLSIVADLAKAEDCARVIAETDRAFGCIDGLVNAAALTDRATVLDAEPDFIDRIMAINLRAPLLLIQEAAKIMLREKIAGSIVNILSMNAHCGDPRLAPYSASKGGLATLTRNAANLLLRDRIRVNGILLGWTDTPAEHVVQEKTSPDGKEWLAKASARLPFGRLIDPEEVGDLVAFLLSRHSGLMTGSLIDYEQRVQGASA